MQRRKTFAILFLITALSFYFHLNIYAFQNPEATKGIKVYNVCDFGAVGDGKTLNTKVIQSAIDACHSDSGGTVLIPAGEFLSGTLELKSNVTFKVATNGRLLGSKKIDDYRRGVGVPRGNGNHVFLYAVNAHNVIIEGRGTIDGQGAAFFNGRGDGTGPGQQSGNMERPHLMIFYQCNNLVINDIFLTNSAYHCVRILRCKYVNFDGIRIQNRVNKNNDGFHFNNTEYVNISNCNIRCQDDACALFGSNKFVTVTNCTFSTRWSIFRFGGGEAENITISNCVIYETYGCPIKMRMGAGSRLENITFSNIIMKDVTGPISIGLDSRSRRRSDDGTEPSKGIVRNIVFNGIRATVVKEPRYHADKAFSPNTWDGETRQAIVLNGVGSNFLENISFTDVHVTYEGGGTAEEAAVRNVPEIAGEYFQIGTPPAYGMYARNVKGLTLQNVRFDYKNNDLRPAVIFDNINDSAINNISVEGSTEAESTFRVINSKDILLTAARLLTPSAIFMQIEGANNENIKIEGGDISKAATKLNFVNGAVESVVKLTE